MRDFRDAKAMAHSLREALKTKSVSLSHSESLELVARTLGLPDWNHLAAQIQSSQPQPAASALPALSVGGGIPIVPMRDLVVFPQMVVPIFVGREKTRRAIERALATDRRVFVLTQRRGADDDPALDALHSVGVTANVIHNATLLDGNLKLFISGIARGVIVRPVEEEFLMAEVAPVDETNRGTVEAAALFSAVLEAYQTWTNVHFSVPPRGHHVAPGLPNTDDPGMLADAIAPLLPLTIEQRQQLLESRDVVGRLGTILELIKAAQQAA
ncbi:MAG: LON peptidase substrate-binding domain-containing protein [Rhizobiales bacterium]|nr:LON peptidase substrate-binding domain-containing protein [Hyphomicrobiales bacterium]